MKEASRIGILLALLIVAGRSPAHAQALNVVDSKQRVIGVYDAGGSIYGDVALREVNGQWLALPISPTGFISVYNYTGQPTCCVLFASGDCSGTQYFLLEPTDAQFATLPFVAFPNGYFYFLKRPAQPLTVGSCSMFVDSPRLPTLSGPCLAPNFENQPNAACAASAGLESSPYQPPLAAPLAPPLDLGRFTPPFKLAK